MPHCGAILHSEGKFEGLGISWFVLRLSALFRLGEMETKLGHIIPSTQPHILFGSYRLFCLFHLQTQVFKKKKEKKNNKNKSILQYPKP